MNAIHLVPAIMVAVMVGCSSATVTEIKPISGSRLAEIHFSSAATKRVFVSGLLERSYAGNYSGLEMSGRELPEPMWVSPGWLKVTYACPQAPEYLLTATIGISRADSYYLYCDDRNVLRVSRPVVARSP